ncbi:altered inheritance of mitochondria protein 31, mitochondrial [Myxozyma melibiosi]|uniref:Respiratory supercomplex factor 1, mitochondrial n=1 Tax=Myxozyma melibiosi TaxID=54550 RepID=A0ABR1FEF5_9ASCO
MPPLPSSFDAYDAEDRAKKLTGFQKLWYKCKEQPLVPLGVFATIFALTKSALSLKAGNSRKANKFFTARVVAQGFTLVALVGGSAYMNSKDSKTQAEIDAEKAARRKKLWLEELERRAGTSKS